MRESAFIDWLEIVDGRDVRQTRDNVSRAKRVEHALTEYLQRSVRLEDEFIQDRCASILENLSIESAGIIPVTINLPKDKNGLSSLRTAVNKYIRFCDETK